MLESRGLEVAQAVRKTERRPDSARAPPAEQNGEKYSREKARRKAHYYNEYATLAMQWAHSDKTKIGDQKLFYRAGKWVCVEKIADGYEELGAYSLEQYDNVKDRVDWNNEANK